MKTLSHITLFLTLSASSYALCIPAIISAISEKETANNPHAIGRSGERTQYQFMQRTWESYSSVPFKKSSLPENSHELNRVINLHIQTLLRYSKRLNLEPSPFNIALLHNAGYGTVQRNTTLPRHILYAQAVTNLYQEKTELCK